MRGWEQGYIGREGTSEAAPEAVRQAAGGGCQSGWGRLLSVTNASEAGTCREGGIPTNRRRLPFNGRPMVCLKTELATGQSEFFFKFSTAKPSRLHWHPNSGQARRRQTFSGPNAGEVAA